MGITTIAILSRICDRINLSHIVAQRRGVSSTISLFGCTKSSVVLRVGAYICSDFSDFFISFERNYRLFWISFSNMPITVLSYFRNSSKMFVTIYY